ncbi:MAG: hypothetical protein KIS92_00875 [Planctomycetota bacterium]|nr:hypothetical protein [Planctomycetota bacterium]
MAATKTETKTLERIWAIATAYDGIGAERCFKGFKRFDDDDNLNKLVRATTPNTQAYFWAGLRSVNSPGRNERKTYRFAAQLLMHVPKDTSNDLVALWEYALGLRDALELDSSYGNGEFRPRVSIALSKINTVEKGGIAVFDFGSGEAGGEMIAIDP